LIAARCERLLLQAPHVTQDKKPFEDVPYRGGLGQVDDQPLFTVMITDEIIACTGTASAIS
jgi:hypothetical protein